MYDPPHTRAEFALIQGDGQLFATHANDPLVRQPSRIRGGPAMEAYRLQRPALGWLGWVASGGQRSAIPSALVGLTVIAVTGLAAVVALWLARRGANPIIGLSVVVLPGVLTNLTRVGPEALGTGLVVAGCLLWLGGARRGRLGAIALFAGAALCRETMLLVPAALAIEELWRCRRVTREFVGLAVTGLPYAAWVVFLRVRIGAWPSSGPNLSFVPLSGLPAGVGLWGPWDLIFFVATFAMIVSAFVKTTDRRMRLIIAAHVGLASLFGPIVWMTWTGFGRVLLPVSALAIVLIANGQADPVVPPGHRDARPRPR
jgi:hypothetical protein